MIVFADSDDESIITKPLIFFCWLVLILIGTFAAIMAFVPIVHRQHCLDIDISDHQ